MQTCDLLTARLWFKLREPVNWAASIAAFAFLFFVLMQIFPAWAAFGVALVAAFCLHFFVLDKRAISIKCPHCNGHIETNTPWVCGYNGCRNDNVDDFPFIYRCEHCGAEPKAYKCHYRGCEKLIFFTKDRQTINYAQCVNFPVKSEPKRVQRDKHAEILAERTKAIERKELEAKETRIDVELKNLRQTLEGPRMKTVEERYRAQLKNEDTERRLRAEIDAEFKNDEPERQRRHLVVDKIMHEML